jgi:uncharacterized protein YbjT (DUF2867 family)
VTILLTGTTGTLSSAVLKGLAGTDHPPLRALVRDPARAAGLSGVEIVQGDLDQPGTLDAAFRGVETLWLLTPMGAIAPHSTSNALWAARKAGVKHVVRVSAVGAGHEAPTRNGRLHALSELEVRAAADFEWTIIRPGYFMQNLFGSLVGDTLYSAIGDGRLAMIDAADIGAFGARVLADPAAHASKLYTITGARTIGLQEAADKIGEVTGTPVTYQPITFDQVHQVMLDAGLSAWDAAVNTEYARAYSGGWGDFTTGDFPAVMGRPARDFAEFARDNLAGLRGQ